MVVRSESDDPTRFVRGASILFPDGSSRVISSARTTDKGLLVRFDGVVDRDGAESLRGSELFVAPDARRQLEIDEYWPDELIGLEVFSAGSGERLGIVVDYVEGGAQDRLGIEGAAGRFEVPFVRDLVPEVDVDDRRITVNDIAGLIP